MNPKRWLTGTVLVGVTLLTGACDVFEPEATLTPIYVTATQDFIIVTNTFTPPPSPVLAPTVDVGQPTQISEVFTQPAPPTATPTVIITNTPTFTPTPSNTDEIEGVPPYVPVGIGIDEDFQTQSFVQGACAVTVQGGFAAIYNNNPALAAQLSCPTSAANTVLSAYQPFERGAMVWVASQGSLPQSAIYTLFNNNNFQAFSDTWRDGVDPVSGGQQPPAANLLEPVRGFGKIWRESGGVKDNLGWATSAENGNQAVIQQFERGTMIYLSQTGQTYILINGAPSVWSAVSVAY